MGQFHNTTIYPTRIPNNTCFPQVLEQINFEKVYPLCKDLYANPCHEMLVGELGLPLSKHYKVKMLYLSAAAGTWSRLASEMPRIS